MFYDPKFGSIDFRISLRTQKKKSYSTSRSLLNWNKTDLKESQLELRKLQKAIFEKQIGMLLLFEGWDAAGKGGAIKRVTDILDPRSYKVSAFAAPTEEENQYNYLWRFWRRWT